MTDAFDPIKALAMPDGDAMKKSAGHTLAFAQSFAITNDEELVFAGEELQAVKTKWNELEAKRTAITDPMNAALRAVNDLFRGPRASLEDAAEMLKKEISGYTIAKARVAEAERAAAAEVARKERERLEAEAQAALKAAEAAQAAGKPDEAAALVDQAAAAQVTASVIVAPVDTAPKVKLAGISTRKGVGFELEDIYKVILHIAEHPEFKDFVVLDEARVRAYVKGLGMSTQFPGIRVFETSSVAAKAK